MSDRLPGAPLDPRLLAEFRSADAMLAALEALRARHYHDMETFTPFDIPEVDGPLELGRSKLGWLVLAGAVVGGVAAYGVQWWANVHSYPLNVGGRPGNAVPAFLLSAFEGTVLGAAVAGFVGLMLVLRLPRLWSVEDDVEGFGRASSDRFWIEMATFVSETDRTHAISILEQAGASRTVPLGRI